MTPNKLTRPSPFPWRQQPAKNQNASLLAFVLRLHSSVFYYEYVRSIIGAAEHLGLWLLVYGRLLILICRKQHDLVCCIVAFELLLTCLCSNSQSSMLLILSTCETSCTDYFGTEEVSYKCSSDTTRRLLFRCSARRYNIMHGSSVHSCNVVLSLSRKLWDALSQLQMHAFN